MSKKENDLTRADLDYIRSRYQKRINESGVSFKSLNSGTQEKQDTRHAIHSSIIKASHSVLDVGCGIGQFYQHLDRRKHTGKYTGIDIVPEYVEYCSEKFSKGIFRIENFFEKKSEEKYDVIVASQVFNAKYPQSNNEKVLDGFLKSAWEQANVSISVDLMTSYVDFNAPELFYFNPELVFSLAKKLTSFVKLRHDYLPYEFTIQLFKSPNENL